MYKRDMRLDSIRYYIDIMPLELHFIVIGAVEIVPRQTRRSIKKNTNYGYCHEFIDNFMSCSEQLICFACLVSMYSPKLLVVP